MQICAEVANTRYFMFPVKESASQVKMRAARLGADSDKLVFASSTSPVMILPKLSVKVSLI